LQTFAVPLSWFDKEGQEMSLVSIISAERERYVSYFETVVAGIPANPSRVRELLISINNDALEYPYRYVRVDLIEKREDGSDLISEVWLDPPENMEAIGFQLGTVTIEIYPFTWCSTQIAFDRSLPDIAKFEGLLMQWLDTSDATTGPSGVANAIHSVTPIETNGQLWFLTIDFGTAPADVLLDLIDFLANEGMVDRIVIASHPR
jgi:hypothetical protein